MTKLVRAALPALLPALALGVGCEDFVKNNDFITSDAEACEAAQLAANDCEQQLGRDQLSDFSCDTNNGASYYSITEWECLEEAYSYASCDTEESYASIDVASCLGY